MAAGQSLVDRIEERFAPRFDKIDRAIAEMVPRREVDATVARLERDIGELQNRPRQAEASANRWIAVAIAGAGLLISGTCSGAALLLQLLSQLR